MEVWNDEIWLNFQKSQLKWKIVCWKICRVRKFFGCGAGAYIFQCRISSGL